MAADSRIAVRGYYILGGGRENDRRGKWFAISPFCMPGTLFHDESRDVVLGDSFAAFLCDVYFFQ